MQRSAAQMASEPLHDIAHLGSVELFTPAPDRSLWYFRDVLGTAKEGIVCVSQL